jgi:hypothetical protein
MCVKNRTSSLSFVLKTISFTVLLGMQSVAVAGYWTPLTHQPQFDGASPGAVSPFGTPRCGTNDSLQDNFLRRL